MKKGWISRQVLWLLPGAAAEGAAGLQKVREVFELEDSWSMRSCLGWKEETQPGEVYNSSFGLILHRGHEDISEMPGCKDTEFL